MVGVVEQIRHNQGGRVLNVPRGFVGLGEALDKTAWREMTEEFGYEPVSYPLVLLSGETPNCNSAFFENPDTSNIVAFYAVRIHQNDVEVRNGELRFKPHCRKWFDSAEDSRRRELITGIAFVPWEQAAQLGDMFSATAVARLLVYIKYETGRAGEGGGGEAAAADWSSDPTSAEMTASETVVSE